MPYLNTTLFYKQPLTLQTGPDHTQSTYVALFICLVPKEDVLELCVRWQWKTRQKLPPGQQIMTRM